MSKKPISIQPKLKDEVTHLRPAQSNVESAPATFKSAQTGFKSAQTSLKSAQIGQVGTASFNVLNNLCRFAAEGVARFAFSGRIAAFSMGFPELIQERGCK